MKKETQKILLKELNDLFPFKKDKDRCPFCVCKEFDNEKYFPTSFFLLLSVINKSIEHIERT